VIEAAVAGVPVVGFNCFGVKEIPGVLADLVPPGDMKALAATLQGKLQSLAADEDRGPEVSIPAFLAQMRQQFDMGRMVRQTWEVYHHFIRN
jgi:hypothetical protein